MERDADAIMEEKQYLVMCPSGAVPLDEFQGPASWSRRRLFENLMAAGVLKEKSATQDVTLPQP